MCRCFNDNNTIKNKHNIKGYPFTLGSSRIYTEMQYIRTSVIPQTMTLKLGSNVVPTLESVHETLSMTTGI